MCEEGINRERIVTDMNTLQEELFCPICLCLLWKPRSCASCRNLFCNSCIQTWLNGDSITCPLCRLPFEEKLAPPSKLSLLSRLHIRCCNSSIGCTEILPYDLLEKHENVECKYIQEVCRRCAQMVLTKDIAHHKSTCKSILTKCPLCKTFAEFASIDQHQYECYQERLYELLRIENINLLIDQFRALYDHMNQNFRLEQRSAMTASFN